MGCLEGTHLLTVGHSDLREKIPPASEQWID